MLQMQGESPDDCNYNTSKQLRATRLMRHVDRNKTGQNHPAIGLQSESFINEGETAVGFVFGPLT